MVSLQELEPSFLPKSATGAVESVVLGPADGEVLGFDAKDLGAFPVQTE